MDGDGGRRRGRDRDSTGWGRTERMGRNFVRTSRDPEKRGKTKKITQDTRRKRTRYRDRGLDGVLTCTQTCALIGKTLTYIRQ